MTAPNNDEELSPFLMPLLLFLLLEGNCVAGARMEDDRVDRLLLMLVPQALALLVLLLDFMVGSPSPKSPKRFDLAEEFVDVFVL